MSGSEMDYRLWSRVVADPGSGCWHWGGSINGYGYGFLRVGGKTRVAHRAMWEHERGPIPEGLQIDHLCRNRACVNPAHLEPVTCRENLRRGFGVNGVNARKTHCIHGHEFTPDNTWTRGVAFRQCKACTYRRKAERKARLAAAGQPL